MSRSSSFTRIPAALSTSAMRMVASATAAALSFLKIGMITHWKGAMPGGMTRPWSSPWTPMRAPTSLSDMPKVVWWTCLCSPFSSS